MGEFELIRRYFERGPARRAQLGIGDDCALLPSRPDGNGRASLLAISTDMLVAGRHFHDDVSPRALGHKSLAVNLSDLAAMGADPRAFTLGLALPAVDEAWLEGFTQGLFELADRHGCELIGGDTTRGPLTICITVFGDCPNGEALRRDRAEPGDDLWVSGELGAPAYAVRERSAGRRLPDEHPAVRRLQWPVPRLELGRELRHLARAAIDLSDGLIGGRLVRASPDLRVPPEPVRQVLALGGGDDYELLFTAAEENRPAIEALGHRLDIPLSRIGRIVAGHGVTVLNGRGKPIHTDVRSFDHFG